MCLKGMYHNALLHTIKCYKSYVINYNKLNIALNLYGCLYIYNKYYKRYNESKFLINFYYKFYYLYINFVL